MIKTEKQFHLNITEGDIGKYVIIPGDPGRCDIIAKYLDDAHFVTQNREFRIFTGTLDGEPVSVCSTGIGGSSAAIAVEELVNCGAHTFLRMGTCGGIDLDVKANDIVIATGAIRFEHTSVEYAPIEYPAVPDFDMTLKLREAALELGRRVHMGVVQCKDSFYGQHEPMKSPVSYELINKWNAWKALGVKASEMESAAVFVVAAARKVRAASCFHVVWNQERQAAGFDQDMSTNVNDIAEIGVLALRKIIAEDRAKAQK